jgi:hypothetical protein
MSEHDEKCQRCGEVGEDRRTLRMECFYAMEELGLPFGREDNHVYTLRVCKDCRATWMAAISGWFKNPQTHQEVGSGIFVRRNGASVEISEEEWRTKYPNREPVRVPDLFCKACNNTRKILEDHDGRSGYRKCTECQ